MSLRLLFVALALCLGLVVAGQNREEIDLEDFIERFFEFQDEDIEYDDLYETLLQLYTSPLDLNNATEEDLQSLYVLNPTQVSAILDYREDNGRFLSIYELQAVPTLDLATIQQILPFVTVRESLDSRPLLERIASNPNKYFILRTRRILETERGFRDEEFLGDRNLLYGRLRVSQKGDYSFGFTFEKDAGEQFTLDEYSGFDFYSAHVMLENVGPFRKVLVGDFQGQWGQGLVYGAGFGVGKGSETINTVRRSSTGIRPYTSVLEGNFLRGAAATAGLGDLELTFLYSNLGQDGNILTDTTFSDFDEFVSSIQVTGFHRTESELARRNQLTEQNAGAVLVYEPTRNLSFGVTTLYSNFSTPIQRRPNNYNQFEFNGDNNYLAGTYFSANWQNFNFFGEAARSKSGGTAAVAGLIASLTSKVDFSFVYRNYARDFHTFYGNAFGEGSRVINEIGTYWGLKIKPWRRHILTVYYDKFRFPWLRFRAEAPSEGLEYLARWTYKPSRSITMFAQFRQEDKDRTFQPEGSNLNILTTGKRRNFVASIDYKLNRFLSLKTRAQGSDFRLGGEKTRGFAILQDVNISFWKMKLSGRMALFDAEDGENRQFLYEKNALYLFSIRGLSGTGTRRYLLVQYNVNRSVSIWARLAQSQFQGAEGITTTEIGSGLSEIQGNTRTELTLQARFKF